MNISLAVNLPTLRGDKKSTFAKCIHLYKMQSYSIWYVRGKGEYFRFYQRGWKKNPKPNIIVRKEIPDKVVKYTIAGEEIRRYKTLTEAAKDSGASPRGVYSVLNGDQKTTAGFVFRYIWLRETVKFGLDFHFTFPAHQKFNLWNCFLFWRCYALQFLGFPRLTQELLEVVVIPTKTAHSRLTSCRIIGQ